jgi:uncharacterized membrane protein YraQ (UPF0718 family)
MWILISFAMITLVIFVVMTVLKIDTLVSIVISTLVGLIVAYFIDRITITYYSDDSRPLLQHASSTRAEITTGAPSIPKNSTSIQSSSSNSNSSNNSYGFFRSGN